MRILLCPDKFKGSLSAEQVCSALRQGLLSTNSNLEIVCLPLADGGDGSIDILKPLLNLDLRKVQSVDPVGRSIETIYYHSDDAAYIEMASASGLILLEESERNPMATSTLGTGLIMKDAIERGFRKIFLFVGGSATNDGGVGIAKALGFDFLDENDASLEPVGSNLVHIHKIEKNSPFDFKDIEITVLCDVINPMHGPSGAAFIYAAQKGAGAKDILTLDEGLKNYSNILRTQMNVDLSDRSGMGAAGAVGASMVGLLNARLENGFQMLAHITHLEEAIKNANLVISGEGKIDQTSFQGKVVGNVLDYCKKYDVLCGIVGGIIEDEDSLGEDFIFQKSIISLAKDIDEALAISEHFLIEIGADIGRQLLIDESILKSK